METYLRKEARRHGSSLQITGDKISRDVERLSEKLGTMQSAICSSI